MIDIDVDTLHWLAGLFEGEACFNKPLPSNPNLRRIALNMTDKEIVERVAHIFGVSAVYVSPRKAHWNPTYLFALIGKRALELMELIYPLMGQRRQQRIAYLLDSYVPFSKRNSNAKLTENDVLVIKQRIAAKEKARLIAEDYGVTIFTIREISQGKIWKEVGVEPAEQQEQPRPGISYNLASIDWLAGLLEAEGSFCPPPPSNPNRPYINLAMTDEDVVERAAKIMDVSYAHIHSKNDRHKDYFFAHPRGVRAVNLMRQLYPLMGKRRQEQIDRSIENYVERADGKGENNAQSKLTSDQVVEIKRRLACGESVKLIAEDQGVSYYTIHDIKRGKSWTHITLE